MRTEATVLRSRKRKPKNLADKMDNFMHLWWHGKSVESEQQMGNAIHREVMYQTRFHEDLDYFVSLIERHLGNSEYRGWNDPNEWKSGWRKE